MASGGDVNAVIIKEEESSYRSCPTLLRPNTTCMGDEVNARDTTAIALVDRKSPTWRNAAFRLAQARLVLVLPREMLHFSRGQQHDSSHFSRKEQHNNNKPTNATTPLSRNQRYVLAPPRIPCALVRFFDIPGASWIIGIAVVHPIHSHSFFRYPGCIVIIGIAVVLPIPTDDEKAASLLARQSSMSATYPGFLPSAEPSWK